MPLTCWRTKNGKTGMHYSNTLPCPYYITPWAWLKGAFLIMENAVIYARYSGANQTEQSIEGQLRDCYAFAERQGLKVVGEYIDRAISGKSDDRPDFQRMIQDSKKRQFSRVIVYKLDRFARNRYDSAIYKHKLKQNGVKVVSAMENISDSPEGIILEAVLEASAEYYSLELSQKVKRGYRESMLKGNYIGGVRPLGYRVENKKLVIHEEEAPVVKWVFEQYASGISKKEIIAALTAKGIVTRSGKPYGMTAFQNALRSKKYIGTLEWAEITVENACPAIVDKVTFDKVQARLDMNRKAGARKKARVEYVLYGKMFCGYCGKNMIGDAGTGKSGQRHHYYACQNRKNHKACTKKNEKKDFIEWYVVEQTLAYVLSPTRMEIIAQGVVDAYDKEFNTGHLDNLERQMSKTEQGVKKLFNMMFETDSKAILKNCEEKIKQLEARQADIEMDIARLKVASAIRYTKEDIMTWLRAFTNGDLFDMDFRRRIIDTFINSIYVYDDKVVLYYNVKDSKQISYIEMLENADDDVDDAVTDVYNDDAGGFGYQTSKPRFKTALKRRFFYA